MSGPPASDRWTTPRPTGVTAALVRRASPLTGGASGPWLHVLPAAARQLADPAAPPWPVCVRSKSTRLEVHRLTPEGLQGVLDVPLYGRVAALQLYRPASEPRDLLLLLTERNKFCVLGFDEDTGAQHCLRPTASMHSLLPRLRTPGGGTTARPSSFAASPCIS